MEQHSHQPSPALVAALKREGNPGSFVEVSKAREMTGLSKSGFRKAALRGEFDIIQLSPRRSVVLEAQVNTWLRLKIEAAISGVAPEGRDALLARARAASDAAAAARKAGKARKVPAR